VSPPEPDRTGSELPSYYNSLLFQIHDARLLVSLASEQLPMGGAVLVLNARLDLFPLSDLRWPDQSYTLGSGVCGDTIPGADFPS
jgi:hypothetical protein